MYNLWVGGRSPHGPMGPRATAIRTVMSVILKPVNLPTVKNMRFCSPGHGEHHPFFHRELVEQIKSYRYFKSEHLIQMGCPHDAVKT